MRLPGLLLLFVFSVFCQAEQHYFSLQLLPQPKPLVEFQLQGLRGDNISKATLMGKWNLLFFGFTHCADICPTELQVFNQLLQQKHTEPLQAIFISLDPERDSLTSLDKFARSFNPNINAVTADHKTLAMLTHFFGVDYGRSVRLHGALVNIPSGFDVPRDEAHDYIVDHSNRIFVVSPRGEFIGSFPAPQNAQKIHEDLQMILKR